MSTLTAGRLIVALTLALYSYYSAWVLFTVRRRRHAGTSWPHLPMRAAAAGTSPRPPQSLPANLHTQPFIEPGQPVLRLFPPRHLALAAPVLAGVGLWGATLITLGCFLVGGELARRVAAGPGGVLLQWAEPRACRLRCSSA